MKFPTIALVTLILSLSLVPCSYASVLWLGYGQSNQAKQGNVEGRGYDIEDYSARFTQYTGSVSLGDRFGVSGFVDHNEDKETIGFVASLRASTHAIELERGWQSGQLTFEDQTADYRSDLLRVGLFEYAEDSEGLEVGLVYYRKTKPTVVKANGISSGNQFLDGHSWLDPEMKYELYGFELRYDSVRKTLNELVASGKSGSSADWYFSFSHIQGIGHVSTSKGIGKPSSSDRYRGDDEWWGLLAAQSRYQLGLAYIKAGSGWALSLDAGVFADLSLPLGIHKDLLSKDKNVPQQERLTTGWEARAGFMF